MERILPCLVNRTSTWGKPVGRDPECSGIPPALGKKCPGGLMVFWSTGGLLVALSVARCMGMLANSLWWKPTVHAVYTTLFRGKSHHAVGRPSLSNDWLVRLPRFLD